VTWVRQSRRNRSSGLIFRAMEESYAAPRTWNDKLLKKDSQSQLKCTSQWQLCCMAAKYSPHGSWRGCHRYGTDQRTRVRTSNPPKSCPSVALDERRVGNSGSHAVLRSI